MFGKNKHLINISQPRHGYCLALAPYFEKQAQTGLNCYPFFNIQEKDKYSDTRYL